MTEHLPEPRAHRPSRHRGSVIVYATLGMVVMVAFVSLAVDFGRVQVARTELQRAADSTARGALVLYLKEGRKSSTVTQAVNQQLNQMESRNPVDSAGNSGLTYNLTWGRWNEQTRVFTASNTNSPTAVRVTGSKTLHLPFASIIGHGNAQVEVEAIAALIGGASEQGRRIDPKGDAWLAGMPNGSTASYNDKAPQNSPKYINVTPGTYVTFPNIDGWVHHVPATSGYGPEGRTDMIWVHGADSPGGPTPAAENGIQDAVMPITAFMGVFLTDQRPDLTPPPNPRRDYTTSASRSKEVYDDIKPKQPFFIGDGKTGPGNGTGTLQRFKVPEGATRLYFSIMDGYEWNNNSGEFRVDINIEPMIVLVK